uniref:Uncharacterized protein n=1 Tax=Rhizophora mucronata TaxID=61149 RepID=A0A2P2NXI6_RHIMU
MPIEFGATQAMELQKLDIHHHRSRQVKAGDNPDIKVETTTSPPLR